MSLPHAGLSGQAGVLKFCLNISARRRAGRCIPFPGGCNTRRGIPALPFSEREISIQRPKPEGYPKELKTIGDHIRKWRIDNWLVQRDVAKILGVCEDSVVGWEIRGISPAIRYIPAITQMLGYLPIEVNTSTIAGKITHYRYSRGITQGELAKELGVNESTVFHYEKGTHWPQKGVLKKLQKVLNFNRHSF